MTVGTGRQTRRALSANLHLLLAFLFLTVPTACVSSKDVEEKALMPYGIKGLEPEHGPVGSTVIIRAERFDGLPEVYFGNIKAEARLLNSQEVEAVVPEGFSVANVYLSAEDSVAQAGHFTATFEDRSPWLALNAGGHHVCGIKKDHTLWCWGENSTSQLGTGVFRDPSRIPLQVPGSWDDVSVPGYILFGNTCARATSGEVSCWGNNMTGPFPKHYGDPISRPTLLPGDWDEVQLGGNLACGVRDDLFFCWSESHEMLAEPILLADEAWQSYSTGYVHGCGIDQARKLFCWGMNHRGQLGNGVTSATIALTPQPVSGDMTWRQVSAGGYISGNTLVGSTCAVSTDDALYCWGSNDHGQLGLDVPGMVTSPALVTDSWESVDVSTHGACGVKKDGSLWCWGRGKHEMVRMGDFSDWQNVTTLRSLEPLMSTDDSPFNKSLSACGIRSDDTAWCVETDPKIKRSWAHEITELAVPGPFLMEPPALQHGRP